jgi:hypothetical protein
VNPEKPENTGTRFSSPHSPDGAIETLNKLSRKGKLAGYRQLDARSFRVQIFGNPYDNEMIGRIDAGGEASIVELHTRLLRRLPTLMIAVFVFATWPGVWLTQSMMDAYVPGTLAATYTYHWYLFLMAVSVPAMWKQFTKSQRAAREHEQEVIAHLREVLGSA